MESSLDWKDIKELAEETTQNLPVTINSLRDVAQIYEEFLKGNAALSKSGREE